MKKNNGDQRLYLGVDIGGTKVQSSLVRESGEIIGREKCPTPRKGGPERVVAAIEKCMDDMVQKGGISPNDLTAIGIAGTLGALGETWLGPARQAQSALYICVGTGIGSGLVQRGRLWRGDRES